MRSADFLQYLWVLQMQGGGDEGILPVLRVPDNAADAVPGEHLLFMNAVRTGWQDPDSGHSETASLMSDDKQTV